MARGAAGDSFYCSALLLPCFQCFRLHQQLLGLQHVSSLCSLTIYWCHQHTLPPHLSACTRRTSSTWTHFPVIYLFHPPGLYSAWTHKQEREMCEGSIFHFRARRGESRDTIIIPEGERESSRRRRERSERKKEEMEDEIRTNCKKNEE